MDGEESVLPPAPLELAVVVVTPVGGGEDVEGEEAGLSSPALVIIERSSFAVDRAHVQKWAMDWYMNFAGRVKLKAVYIVSAPIPRNIQGKNILGVTWPSNY